MPLLTIIIVICVVGVILWLVETYLPLDPTIKRILQVVVIIVLVVWLLQVFGVMGAMNSVRVGGR